MHTMNAYCDSIRRELSSRTHESIKYALKERVEMDCIHEYCWHLLHWLWTCKERFIRCRYLRNYMIKVIFLCQAHISCIALYDDLHGSVGNIANLKSKLPGFKSRISHGFFFQTNQPCERSKMCLVIPKGEAMTLLVLSTSMLFHFFNE
jgi:hypothetical protein